MTTTNHIRLHRSRGSASVVVISVLTVAALVAAACLTIGNSHRRVCELESDFSQAQVYAVAAIEAAAAQLRSDENWRTNFVNYQNRESVFSKTFGDDQLSWFLKDDVDDTIFNNRTDPFRIHGRGVLGTCRRELSVLAFPIGQPIEALRSTLHATGTIQLSDSVISGHGPISSSLQIHGNNHIVHGSIEAPVWTNTIITAGKATSTSGKYFPGKSVFDAYRTLATEVDTSSMPSTWQISDQVINRDTPPTPTTAKNANGVYFVNVPSMTKLWINNCKITGTLIVNLGEPSSDFQIGEGVVWNPQSDHLPSLIVYAAAGNNQVDLQCSGRMTATDQNTEAGLNGLFHIIRAQASGPSSPFAIFTRLSGNNPIRGTILVDGGINISSSCRLLADPKLLARPPLGYCQEPDSNGLLENGDFDSQISPWYSLGSTDSRGGTQIHRDTDAQAGSHSLLVSNRPGASFGAAQDVTKYLARENLYTGVVYAKMVEASDNIQITLELESDSGIDSHIVGSQQVDSQWTPITCSISATWEGNLKAARIVISSVATSGDFLIDTAELMPPVPSPRANIAVFPTTFRLEPGN
jgi:hypothetical protein